MDQERTYKWIQDRLRDLHSGTISEADRLRLDEMANTDPFVRDALEGYQAHADHDHSALLKLLSQRIQNKNASRRPKLMPLSRGWVIQAVAASLVLILSTWAVIYYVDKSDDAVFVGAEAESSAADERTTEVTLTQPDSLDNDMVMSSETSVDNLTSEPSGLRANAQARMEADADAKAMASEKAKESAGSSEHTSTPLSTGGAGSNTDVTMKEKDEYTFSDPAISAPASGATEEDILSNPPPQTATQTKSMDANMWAKTLPDEGYYANQMNPAMMARRVAGKVVAETGDPLIGVNLAIQNTNLGTITDYNGTFELFLPEKEAQVDVMYSGYVDASIKLMQGAEDVIITLPQSGQTLDEVIVTEKRREVKTQNVPAGRAYAPTRVRDSAATFNNYLRENTRIPIQENLNAPVKEVMLEFIVSDKGRPEQIKILRSSNQREYDDEAVRLIRKGPEWECEMGLYPCTARYTIYFQ